MPDPVETVRRGYDALSRHYRADDVEAGQYAPWIAQLLTGLGSGSRVLDIGCGCGVPVARDLAAAGHDVTGVDISDVQIDRARRLVPKAAFIRADVTTLRLAARSYDAVVALYSLIHVPLAAQQALLTSVSDWLVDDGLLLLTAGWQAWTGSAAGWLGGEAEMWWSHADVATRREWLAQRGFRVVREEFVAEGDSGHSLFWARRSPRSRQLSP
jgi:SAM-dependent methyltransferase